MNREELVKKISKKSRLTQTAVSEVLSSMIDIILKNVSKGKKVTLVGFGSFEASHRDARVGRNPYTNEVLNIPAKRLPAFSAGKRFRKLVLDAQK